MLLHSIYPRVEPTKNIHIKDNTCSLQDNITIIFAQMTIKVQKQYFKEILDEVETNIIQKIICLFIKLKVLECWWQSYKRNLVLKSLK